MVMTIVCCYSGDVWQNTNRNRLNECINFHPRTVLESLLKRYINECCFNLFIARPQIDPSLPSNYSHSRRIKKRENTHETLTPETIALTICY
jgi:hypothetical protein